MTTQLHTARAGDALGQRLARTSCTAVAAVKELVNRAPEQSLAAPIKLERDWLRAPSAQ